MTLRKGGVHMLDKKSLNAQTSFFLLLEFGHKLLEKSSFFFLFFFFLCEYFFLSHTLSF